MRRDLTKETYLNPIYDAGYITGLQQELLSFHADTDHVPSLHIVTSQPTLGIVQRVCVQQILRLRERDRGVVDPQMPPLYT